MFLGVDLKSAGYKREECPTYHITKIGLIDEDKYTNIPIYGGEIGWAYALKEKEDGKFCWYGPQKQFRPNIGKRMLIWGGHMHDWIATSAVQAYSIINDVEGADKLVISKELLDAGFEIPQNLEVKDGDVFFMTRNSFYFAKKR